MLIDFHTHCFPEKIAQRAIDSLAKASGGLMPQTDGTVTGLKESMKRDGVDISVVQSIATNPKQMQSVNDFAASLTCNEIVPFGSIHPEAENWEEELERIKALGLKGIKFHPEYQNFYVNDPKMKPIYKKIGELGLITMFHAGRDLGFAPPFHGMPDHFVEAVKWFDSPIVLAHFGGAFSGEEVLEKLCRLPLYIDTSFSYSVIPRATAQAIVEKHGTDNILFGSDTPWHRPSWEVRLIEHLDMSEADRQKIYHENAEKLLSR